MVVKRNYVIGIINHERIPEVNKIIFSYSNVARESTSYLYFAKQPIAAYRFISDTTFFQLVAENERSLNKKLNDLIRDLDELNGDYVLKDEESGKLLVVVEFGGSLTVKFDNISMLNKGTFEKIDDLKKLKMDFGYSRGFKPDFRPFEGRSIEDLQLTPEIIYLISDSPENLSKFREYVSEKIFEIDPNFELDFTHFKKASEYWDD